MRDYFFFVSRQVVSRLLNLLAIAALFLSFMPVPAQQKKETNKSADDDDVIKVTANLVSLDVIVKDKKGKAITDLKPEDFTVFENGVPQKIQFFDSTLTSGSEAGQSTAPTDSTGPKPRTPNGFPRNIIALVLDGQSTDLANLKPCPHEPLNSIPKLYS